MAKHSILLVQHGKRLDHQVFRVTLGITSNVSESDQKKPETPNACHATPHFGREMQMKTHQARQFDLSRLRRLWSAAVWPNKASSTHQEVYLWQV